jgi:hypothetical protein
MLVQQSVMKVMKSLYLDFRSFKKFTVDISSIWNVLDLMRLGSFWVFMIQNGPMNHGTDIVSNNTAFLITTSWISLLEQFRLSNKF